MFVTLGVLIDISASRTALRGFDTVSALRNFDLFYLNGAFLEVSV